ncbi:caspase-14-like [Phodopus roborovskii]|uniref:caspase-14-like n=1 Tax=Phodopus roborovskii TaxID=109678 RepID=UPI0021E46342|nr:caspase-14-like [Phodopus roborovskii]
MAFLVSGTLQTAAQLADAWDSLGRKGKYSVQGSRVALILSTPGVSAAAIAALDGVSQALGFEIHEKRKVPVQSFLEELRLFREQLDVHRGVVGCALVVLMAPSGQLRCPQLLTQELSHCGALQGCPKIFLLFSSDLKGE